MSKQASHAAATARRRGADPAARIRPHLVADTGPAGWEKLRPRTLVDQAMEAIIAGASRGLILPGDRIVETEIATALGISRVPVREALRLLESQGLVVSEPYKGIRLMPVTQARLEQATEVRLALEVTAARRARKLGRHRDDGRQRLAARLRALELMAARGDAYGCARADTDFHRELCELSGNAVLCRMWEQSVAPDHHHRRPLHAGQADDADRRRARERCWRRLPAAGRRRWSGRWKSISAPRMRRSTSSCWSRNAAAGATGAAPERSRRSNMKITDVEAIILRLPEIQARTDWSQDALLVKISTDAGITGWGEVDGCPAVAKAVIEAGYSHTQVNGLRAILLGEDPLATTRLWDKMYAADALLRPQRRRDPGDGGGRYRALGHQGQGTRQAGRRAARRRAARPDARLFLQHVPVHRRRRRWSVPSGPSIPGTPAVKFGWEPFGRDAATDLRYVEAIRKAIGDENDFMLDVGLAWDAKTTIQRARLFEPYNLFWIEEPLHPDDYAGLRQGLPRLHCSTSPPASRSAAWSGFERLIDEGGIDIVQIDLTRCGFTQAMRIAAYRAAARAQGRATTTSRPTSTPPRRCTSCAPSRTRW